MSGLHIGMIGTRFAGLDGVTLESLKVADVLRSLGYRVSWFGGRIGPGFEPAFEDPEAYFDTPENHELNAQVFQTSTCPDAVLEELERRAGALQTLIANWVEEERVDVLMPQNASAIPVQLPLGLAIARHAAAARTATLAHHHDLAWERDRFWPNAVGGVLDEAFPPKGASVGHLAINTLAAAELRKRKGIAALVLPNIMDFANPPDPGDGTAFRHVAGLSETDVVLLQPTRMIPRKGIEDTVRLAQRLGDPAIKVVVTHPEPDEGAGYVEQLIRFAESLSVDFRIVPANAATAVGLADAYAAADLVTYPSRIEGFGNALVETFYFRRPVLINRFPVYRADIGPRGVQAIEMEDELTDEVVASAARWLADADLWADAVAANYEVGRRFFSYEAASAVLAEALDRLAS
ncbi:MAG: glycosyltransferase [Acidimicrobiia bacterium]|nr:glycosyltransferase [Acidimicrobiia bacterium]